MVINTTDKLLDYIYNKVGTPEYRNKLCFFASLNDEILMNCNVSEITRRVTDFNEVSSITCVVKAPYKIGGQYIQESMMTLDGGIESSGSIFIVADNYEEALFDYANFILEFYKDNFNEYSQTIISTIEGADISFNSGAKRRKVIGFAIDSENSRIVLIDSSWTTFYIEVENYLKDRFLTKNFKIYSKDFSNLILTKIADNVEKEITDFNIIGLVFNGLSFVMRKNIISNAQLIETDVVELETIGGYVCIKKNFILQGSGRQLTIIKKLL